MEKLTNDELLQLLQTNVLVFNACKREYLEQEIHFADVDLHCANLCGTGLNGADLTGVKLGNVLNLMSAKLTGATMSCKAYKILLARMDESITVNG